MSPGVCRLRHLLAGGKLPLYDAVANQSFIVVGVMIQSEEVDGSLCMSTVPMCWEAQNRNQSLLAYDEETHVSSIQAGMT